MKERFEATLVMDLTDTSTTADGSRAARKAIDRSRLQFAHKDAKTIKLADLINNTESILERDKKFAAVYMHEKKLLLEVLKGGDQTLWNMANNIATNYFAEKHDDWDIDPSKDCNVQDGECDACK